MDDDEFSASLIDQRSGEADTLFDELDAEARACGYEGAGDIGFRLSLAPELRRAHRIPRCAAAYQALLIEDDEDI